MCSCLLWCCTRASKVHKDVMHLIARQLLHAKKSRLWQQPEILFLTTYPTQTSWLLDYTTTHPRAQVVIVSSERTREIPRDLTTRVRFYNIYEIREDMPLTVIDLLIFEHADHNCYSTCYGIMRLIGSLDTKRGKLMLSLLSAPKRLHFF